MAPAAPFRSRFSARWAALLLAGDIVLVAVFLIVAFRTGGDLPNLLDIEKQDSIASSYIYAKWLAAAVALLIAAKRGAGEMTRSFGYIFLIILFDDSLELHERVGEWLATGLGVPALPGLRVEDSGELMIWALWGVIAALLLFRGWRRDGPEGRRFGLILTGLIGLLAVFGILGDMAHVMAARGGMDDSAAAIILAAVEDGGELLVASLMVAFAIPRVPPKTRALP
ncbi:hypothetical protein [Tropicimonas sp. IMCC34011]|uniref:hypothetical protein n=1 Tax=Tropicimonas sp. IMCC34011 TaxID=2248759 RepID=UPI000E233CA4|nr:hypothetical protein [Tropicimonas sp. IMCC34011]